VPIVTNGAAQGEVAAMIFREGRSTSPVITGKSSVLRWQQEDHEQSNSSDGYATLTILRNGRIEWRR
jgi:hypothetical protein